MVEPAGPEFRDENRSVGLKLQQFVHVFDAVEFEVGGHKDFGKIVNLKLKLEYLKNVYFIVYLRQCFPSRSP